MLSTPCAFFVTICYSSTLLLLLSCYHHFFPRAPLSSYGFTSRISLAARFGACPCTQFVIGVDTPDLGSWFLPSFATLHLLLTLLLRNLNHAEYLCIFGCSPRTCRGQRTLGNLRYNLD